MGMRTHFPEELDADKQVCRRIRGGKCEEWSLLSVLIIPVSLVTIISHYYSVSLVISAHVQYLWPVA